MIRLLILIFCIVGYMNIGKAQVSYGLKMGLTQSFVSQSPEVTNSNNSLQTGFQFGLFLDKTIARKFVFRPSMQITQKGYQSVTGSPGGPFYWSKILKTTYLEIPLEVLKTFEVNESSDFYLGTGPIISYGLTGRLNATIVSTDNNQQLHTLTTTDYEIFKNNLDHRFDFGWNFSTGYRSCRLLFNASFNLGIMDVTKDNKQSLRNRSLAFTVGYIF